ncbi:unnamed protein product [Urochloa decumbens]|uniref:Uncharacterized protein n=1 Tax=Urochloa decumbens TaxID=240449 RepID=A0ABC9AR19_9POAL
MEKEEAKEAPDLLAGGADAESEMSRSARNNLVMLTQNAQLQRLALLLRNNEQVLMRRVVMTERERVQYLQTVNDAYRDSMRLVDDSTAFKDSQSVSGGSRSIIARDVHDYVIYGINMCLQNVRNSCMRHDAIAKLRSHYDALTEALAAATTDEDLSTLAAEAADYKDSMWEYCHRFRSASARARSKAYSDVLKLQGIELPDLLKTHQVKLGYSRNKEFEDLDDAHKLDVYNSIIDESKRATIRLFSTASRQSRIKGKTVAHAVSVFIIAAGNMVYDIYTTEHNVEQVLRGSLNVLAAVGAFAVEAVVTKAVTTALVRAGLGIFVTSLAGFVIGAIAGLIFVTVSGLIIDRIVRSPRVPPIADLKFHTAVMPDGMSLAIAISRG